MEDFVFSDPKEKQLVLDALNQYWLSCIQKLQMNNLGFIEHGIVEKTKIELLNIINRIR